MVARDPKRAPLLITEQGTVGETQIGHRDAPSMFQSWPKALIGLPTIGCVTFREASQRLQRQSCWNCSRLVSPWP